MKGLKHRVQGFTELRLQGLESRVEGLGCRTWGLGFRVYLTPVGRVRGGGQRRGDGAKSPDLGFSIKELGFRSGGLNPMVKEFWV